MFKKFINAIEGVYGLWISFHKPRMPDPVFHHGHAAYAWMLQMGIVTITRF